MCDALRELMKDEIAKDMDAARKEGRKAGRAEGSEEAQLSAVRSIMETMSLTAKEAMNALKISAKDQKRLVAML